MKKTSIIFKDKVPLALLIISIFLTIICFFLFFWIINSKLEPLEGASFKELYNMIFPEIVGALFGVFLFYGIILLTGKTLDSLVLKNSETQNLDILAKSENIMGRTNKNLSELHYYTPIKIYDSVKGIDHNYNRDISQEIKKSKLYLFRGVSAKYVSVRISQTKHSLNGVKVIILNPQNEVIIALRANSRQRNPESQKKSFEELKDEVRYEIYKSIVGLYDSKMKCPIEICFSEDTSVTRIEMFDDALFLLLYYTLDTSSSDFPITLKYDKNSIFHDLYRKDFYRVFDEISKEKFIFNSKSTEKDLIKILNKIGMKNFTEKQLQQIRDENNIFSQEFVNISKINTY